MFVPIMTFFRTLWGMFTSTSLVLAQPFLLLLQRIGSPIGRQLTLLFTFGLLGAAPIVLQYFLVGKLAAVIQLFWSLGIIFAGLAIATVYFLVERDLEGITQGFLYRPAKSETQRKKKQMSQPIARYAYLEGKVSLPSLFIACIGMAFGFTLFCQAQYNIGLTSWYTVGEVAPDLRSWLFYTLLNIFRAIDIFDTLITYDIVPTSIQQSHFISSTLVFVFKAVFDIILISKIRSWWQRRNLIIETVNALKYHQTRQRAQNTLIRMGKRATTPLCVVLRNADSWLLRARVAEVLGAIKDPKAFSYLFEAFQEDTNVEVRIKAALALGELGRETAEQYSDLPLLSTFSKVSQNEEQVEELRVQTIRALGKLKVTEAIPDLLHLLETEPEATEEEEDSPMLQEDQEPSALRKDAAWALGQFPAHFLGPNKNRVIDALLEALEDMDASDDFNVEAARALSNFGSEALGPERQQRCVEGIWNLVENEYVSVDAQYEAAVALMELGEHDVEANLRKMGKRSIPTFIQLFQNPPDEETKIISARALAYLKAKEAAAILLRTIQYDALEFDNSEAVRVNVIRSLGYLKAREAIPYMLKSLQPGTHEYEVSEDIRVAIVRALGQLRAKQAGLFLLRSLRSSATSPHVRAQIARTAGMLRLKTAVPILLGIVQQEQLDEDLRAYAIEALGMLRAPQAVPLIFKAMMQDEYDNYQDSYDVEEEYEGDYEEEEYYGEEYDEEYDEDSEEWDEDYYNDTEDYHEILWDEESWQLELWGNDVGRTAAWALGTMKAKKVIPNLLRIIQDQEISNHVKSNAIRVLGTLKVQKALPFIQWAQQHPDLEEAAQEALEKFQQ